VCECVIVGVIPDDDMGYLLKSIFGDKSHAFRKYRRMMYWMPKFRFANPYYVPYNLPADRIELAKLALKRMAVDLENEVSVFMVRHAIIWLIEKVMVNSWHKVMHVGAIKKSRLLLLTLLKLVISNFLSMALQESRDLIVFQPRLTL